MVLLGNWVGTLSGRGGASLFGPSVCAMLASSPPQAPGAGPWLPFPSPKHLSLTIKFSIFGVLVSYFPGTERRSERDWKRPFVLRSLPNFRIPSLCPFLLPRPALYPNPVFIYHRPISPHIWQCIPSLCVCEAFPPGMTSFTKKGQVHPSEMHPGPALCPLAET